MDEIFPAASNGQGVVGKAARKGAAKAIAQHEAKSAEAAPAAAVEPTPDEQQKAQAARWKKRIKYFGKQMEADAKRWARNRRHVNGEEGDDGGQGLVRVNLIASVVNTIQPNIYAKAPEVSVQPEERIDPSQYADIKGFSKTLELALNRYAVRGTKLKARGKEAVRASLTCTTGWVKVVYQKDIKEDPLIRNRMNDAQDNIERIEQLLRETEDEAACGEHEAKMAELKQQVAALESQVEVTVSEGLVIDNVPAERILILDASIKNIDEYEQASAIAHGVFMSVGTYKTQFGGKEPPKKARRYKAVDDEDVTTDANPSSTTGIDSDDELVLVWEIWCKDDLTVYTQCDGADEYCRDPYQPETLGQQWYCFFPLQLWRVAGYLNARALVDNLIELVEEYNTRRTVAAEHRRKNMPVRLLNRASGITDKQITAINDRGASTDIVGIDADPNVPLANQLGTLPEIPYNPAMYDTTDILRDVEMVSGAQDASRGGVNQAKTATEAEIISQGMQSRTADQLDAIEDWLTAIMIYCAQLLMLNMGPAQIKKAFGDSAVWPELSKKELFEQVMVVIRAGSTSKPNKMRERDQWLQFLPQLQEAVMKISELRQGGQDDLADALIKLLDETLRRFDERMSIKEFLPGMADDEGGDGDPQQKMLEQVKKKVAELTQQAEEALAQRKQQVEQQEADVAKRGTDLQVREIQQKATEQVFGLRTQYEDAARQLEQREAADNVVATVRDLLQQHDQKVRDMLAAPDPQALVDQARQDLQAQIDQLVGTINQQPEQVAQEPAPAA